MLHVSSYTMQPIVEDQFYCRFDFLWLFYEKSPTVLIGMQLNSVMKREEGGGQRVKLCCAS